MSIVGTWPDVEKRLSSCHAFFMAGRCAASSVLLSLGRCLFFVVRRVRCAADRRRAARALQVFGSSGLMLSGCLAVRPSFGLSCCPVVRLSLSRLLVSLLL